MKNKKLNMVGALLFLNTFVLAQVISYDCTNKVCLVKFKVGMPHGESSIVTQILGRTATVDFGGEKFGISPTIVDNEKGTVQFDLFQLSSNLKEITDQDKILESLVVGNQPVETNTDPQFALSLEKIIYK